MPIRTINIETLLTPITWKDPRFHAKYSIDPYQNCAFSCLYCDSSYDPTIQVKLNAANILEEELQTHTKGTILIGTVHDPYQPAEQTYHITHQILETLKHYDYPIHILTKSHHILDDLELLQQLKTQVTISIISTQKTIYETFEPRVSNTPQRLETIQCLNNAKIPTGASLMPLLPGIVEEELPKTIQTIKESNAQWLQHKHLELKGDQYRHFTACIQQTFPRLLPLYTQLYHESYKPPMDYIESIDTTIQKLCEHYQLKQSIPMMD